MKSRFLILTLAVGLLGCKGKPASDTVQEAAKAVSQPPTTYTLRIAFTGLIGFAQDKNETVWALLVKANKVDPSDENTLPPGILKEAQQGGVDLIQELPLHKPWIRVHSADVVSGPLPNPETGRDIAGDLHFETGVAGPPNPKLSYLSDPGHIKSALAALKPPPDPAKVAAAGELDPSFLDTSTLDPHLVARVRIDAGTVIAKIDPCERGTEYSYNTGVSDQCPGDGVNKTELGEEVDVTQDVPIDKTVTVVIGADKIELKPKAGSREIRIEIMNDIDAAITSPAPCSATPHPHPLVFRWFYRLVPQSAQNDTSQHYFPCRLTGRELPPICPMMRFTVTQKAKP